MLHFMLLNIVSHHWLAYSSKSRIFYYRHIHAVGYNATAVLLSQGILIVMCNVYIKCYFKCVHSKLLILNHCAWLDFLMKIVLWYTLRKNLYWFYSLREKVFTIKKIIFKLKKRVFTFKKRIFKVQKSTLEPYVFFFIARKNALKLQN